MRILHVIPDLNPAAGGPPMVVSRLAAAQAAERAPGESSSSAHQVSIAFYDTPTVHEQIQHDVAALPGGDRLTLHHLPEPNAFERVTARSAQRALAPLVQAADVVHLHGVWAPILKVAARLARRHSKPYILAPHGMLDPWALSEKRTKKRVALAMGFGRMIHGAAALHAHSVYEHDSLVEGRWNAHVQTVPNGVFLDEFRPLPAKDAFHHAHPELQRQPYILFLARLHEVKGLDLLADAFASITPELANVRLVIVGPDFGARDALVEQTRRLGIADRVHLIGPLYARDRIAAYAGAACFCLPSKHESFGISVAEAMACGVPVVVSESCHFPDVGEFETGRVVRRDVPAIATALREVLSNPALAERMGQAGIRLIEQRYTWNRVASASVVMYQQRLAPGSPIASAAA